MNNEDINNISSTVKQYTESLYSTSPKTWEENTIIYWLFYISNKYSKFCSNNNNVDKFCNHNTNSIVKPFKTIEFYGCIKCGSFHFCCDDKTKAIYYNKNQQQINYRKCPIRITEDKRFHVCGFSGTVISNSHELMMLPNFQSENIFKNESSKIFKHDNVVIGQGVGAYAGDDMMMNNTQKKHVQHYLYNGNKKGKGRKGAASFIPFIENDDKLIYKQNSRLKPDNKLEHENNKKNIKLNYYHGNNNNNNVNIHNISGIIDINYVNDKDNNLLIRDELNMFNNNGITKSVTFDEDDIDNDGSMWIDEKSSKLLKGGGSGSGGGGNTIDEDSYDSVLYKEMEGLFYDMNDYDGGDGDGDDDNQLDILPYEDRKDYDDYDGSNNLSDTLSSSSANNMQPIIEEMRHNYFIDISDYWDKYFSFLEEEIDILITLDDNIKQYKKPQRSNTSNITTTTLYNDNHLKFIENRSNFLCTPYTLMVKDIEKSIRTIFSFIISYEMKHHEKINGLEDKVNAYIKMVTNITILLYVSMTMTNYVGNGFTGGNNLVNKINNFDFLAGSNILVEGSKILDINKICHVLLCRMFRRNFLLIDVYGKTFFIWSKDYWLDSLYHSYVTQNNMDTTTTTTTVVEDSSNKDNHLQSKGGNSNNKNISIQYQQKPNIYKKSKKDIIWSYDNTTLSKIEQTIETCIKYYKKWPEWIRSFIFSTYTYK